MPVRHFDIFTAERRLLQHSSLVLLKDIRLGIDGTYWLRKLLQSTVREAAPAAMGGVPFGLKAAIERDLELFRSHNIQPFFVFNGLALIRKDKPFSSEDFRPQKRANAWDAYEKGKIDQAMSGWISSGSTYQPDLLSVVFEVLHSHDIEFIRAPYSAWAQLVYLEKHSKEYIHAIYGSSELLMYDVDKVIIGMDLEKGNYTWVSKKSILQDLQVNDEQFLDICILAGFEYSSTFPPLQSDMMSFTFKGVIDMIKQYKTGFNAVQGFADHAEVIKTKYVDHYCRIRCAIKYHPILNQDNHVEPLNAENAPTDIHEFIGYRLPDEVYYYLTQCLINPQVINNLESGVLIELPPLCNGETIEYHKFLTKLLEIRVQSLNLLVGPLHQFYHSRKVVSIFWFEPNVEHPMNHQDAMKTNEWLIPQNIIQQEQKNPDASPDFGLALTSLHRFQEAHNPNLILETKDQIILSILLNLLERRRFIESNRTLTKYGRAYLDGLKQGGNRNSEELYLALELIRADILRGEAYSKTYFGSSNVGTEEEKKNISLICRVISLLKIQAKSQPWAGSLNRDLLVTNGFVKTLTKSLRNLVEMSTLNLLLTNKCTKDRKDYLDIAFSLPFLHDTNTALSIVTKSFLERTVQSKGDSAASIFISLNETFSSCLDLKSELDRAFGFWNQIFAAVKTLHSEKSLDTSRFIQFENADKWLKSVRP
ncbi:hypothetical protein K7432_010006 [Basidiobolus ranarum]|uniref:Uncharacterized protein n=1 Tax=Basidiobolus ranarum TaxID=34480 RepID=A0ABR2WPC6_9FUNG